VKELTEKIKRIPNPTPRIPYLATRISQPVSRIPHRATRISQTASRPAHPVNPNMKKAPCLSATR